jgi:hypothetical protein
VNTILFIRQFIACNQTSNKKKLSVEEVVDLIKAREVEQGLYGTKGLTN